ncbi:hypothetical protein VTK73DRAFT_4480 [Phialemonium thermophilum]|uniref:Zn(2)-C6 fungal-type domain-containing protein n=1 Tax=Phialemonium thermophilum TaxID=223376 RepID=A0ABR3WTQ8_9PEZI
MVGVPGKYKGCETCRARRVKCDNERPVCKKQLIPKLPVQPAWDDLIVLSTSEVEYKVQIAALRMDLRSLVKGPRDADDEQFYFNTLCAYEHADVQPFTSGTDFELSAECLIHLSEPVDNATTETEATDNICLFLYDHNNSTIHSTQAPWLDPLAQTNPVRKCGPETYRAFPNHHFFVRVYRHTAIGIALLNRKKCFLADPEWLTTPWEVHPKSFLDQLFDIIAMIPSIFARADRVFLLEPTMRRRLMAQDLLGNCLNLERQLLEWYASVNPTSTANVGVPNFWLEDPDLSDAQIPFADTFGFRDAVIATALIYYWAVLVLFYPCIERLQRTIFEPVLDVFPPPPPNLPHHLAIDNLRYGTKEVREIAANVCRSLDFALHATVQPDVFVVPLHIVQEFYAAINESAGDGQLEIMWCEGFRMRLTSKGQDIANVIKCKKWRDVATF